MKQLALELLCKILPSECFFYNAAKILVYSLSLIPPEQASARPGEHPKGHSLLDRVSVLLSSGFLGPVVEVHTYSITL